MTYLTKCRAVALERAAFAAVENLQRVGLLGVLATRHQRKHILSITCKQYHQLASGPSNREQTRKQNGIVVRSADGRPRRSLSSKHQGFATSLKDRHRIPYYAIARTRETCSPHNSISTTQPLGLETPRSGPPYPRNSPVQRRLRRRPVTQPPAPRSRR